MDKWRKSRTISVKDICDIDLDKCHCSSRVIAQEDEEQQVEEPHMWICNPLYTLTGEDHKTIQEQNGWLGDTVIAASQLLLLQDFPNMDGLQPPALQEVGGFQSHSSQFVQIINVEEVHCCVASNVGCREGNVNVYDTYYPCLKSSTIPIIVNLVFTQHPINMLDVEKQGNKSDCGVLSIAIAYDLCSRQDPALENNSFTRFPVAGERTGGVSVKSSEVVDLFCSCRMPEEEDINMALWDECQEWYHKHCMDIPDEVFLSDEEVPWKCKTCCDKSTSD